VLIQKIGRLFKQLHNDETGEIPVGQILTIGLVVIPLVIGLVAFGDSLSTMFDGAWKSLTGQEVDKPAGGTIGGTSGTSP